MSSAIPHEGPGYGESIRLVSGQGEGRRHYAVDTRDPALALEASGLPRPGDPWSPAYTRLVCVGYDTVRVLGGVTDAAGGGGWCVVPVVYRTPGFAGRTGALPGTRTLRFEFVGADSVTVYKPIDPSPDQYVLDNGRGAPRDVGRHRAVVTRYDAPGSAPAQAYLQRLISLATEQAVNSDAVALPPLVGTNDAYYLPAGQGRFNAWGMDFRDGLVVTEIQILIAADHHFRWLGEDENGNPMQSLRYTDRVYPERPFAGLW